MKNVLIVDDEPAIVTLLQYNLKRESFEVDTTGNGREALDKIRKNNYTIVLLDLMLPELSGEEVLKQMRMDRIATPVIILTAKDTEFDKVFGLEMGADDYIAKPFSPREVIARINAVLRRTSASDNGNDSQNSSDQLVVGEFVIDKKQYRVLANGNNLNLTPKEFELFSYLASHDRQVFSRDQLLSGVWGFDYGGESRMVDIQIAHLRDKIEPDPKHPIHLKTIRGVGYQFVSGDE
ncbi:response regulator transcription factor [Lentilactobacillus sp. SPB1-3]|uniref:Response regulator transcription factor n=1 Tax=Lentilactobacillus terminaliae TaxID=3003483 RepID=A0ACD5DGF1_9LACO|nr:response regulator transcription factor [Lentilactobacillus sp. SPB1-3]MCZ0976942.1 response regulator transcription factor [Lentilactobacillus sp. SPB1-3]